MALTDIASLPLLVVVSLRARAFLAPIIYVQMLRVRYSSISGSKYHKPVWAVFGQRAQPYVAMAPQRVQTVVQMAVRWFTAAP
jgi:hypothetical protein